MSINEAKKTKLNTVSSHISEARTALAEAKEPLLRDVRDKGIFVTDTQKKELSIENYLSRRDKVRWKRMPEAKRQRVLGRIKRSRAYQGYREVAAVEMDTWKQGAGTEFRKKEKDEKEKKRKEQTSGEQGFPETGEVKDQPIGEGISAEVPSQTDVKAAGKELKEASQDIRTVTEAGVDATGGAATGGTSTAVKAGIRLAKKTAEMFSTAVQPDESESLPGTAVSSDITEAPAAEGLKKITTIIVALPVILVQALAPVAMAILIPIMVCVLVLTLLTGIFSAADQSSLDMLGLANVSPEVLAYKSLVEKYAKEEGVSEYVPWLLAIIQVESEGRGDDVMQSSESMGLPPGSLKPEASIKQGVKHFANNLHRAESMGVDFDSVIQAYNYGGGFLDYVNGNGKKFSLKLAESFANEHAHGRRVRYSNPIAVSANGGWRYAYGNMFYVPLVKQYVLAVSFDDKTAAKIIKEALKYEGKPYVFGGTDPNNGIDCSGFTMWCYGKVGISLPHNAQAQYDMTQHISPQQAKPGDLVFFHGTYNSGTYITHVEIYVGNGRCFGAGSPIGYHDLTDNWHTAHFAGFGRVRK